MNRDEPTGLYDYLPRFRNKSRRRKFTRKPKAKVRRFTRRRPKYS